MKNLKELEIEIVIDNSNIPEEELKKDLELIENLKNKKKRLDSIKKSIENNIKKLKSEEFKEDSVKKKRIIEENISNDLYINEDIIPIIEKKEEKKNNKLLFEIEKINKIPDDYYQRPSNLSKIIINFPGFKEIKEIANNKIDNSIKEEINNSNNKEFIIEMYLNDKDYDNLKIKLSKSDLENFPKGEKDLLKYIPKDFPGINIPKLLYIECKPNEAIELTKLYNIFNVKKNRNQFRRFILNISEDVNIHNFIIEKNYVNSILSDIKFDKINIGYFKSLKIPFYSFILKPNETLIIEPGSIHFSYIENKSESIIYSKIIYWSNSTYDNFKDLNCAIQLNPQNNFFPLTISLIQMINENLLKLSLTCIKEIQLYLQKVLSNENKIINEYKNEKKFCKYYNKNIINCSDCNSEIINYYTFINKKKIICPNCFPYYSLEIIFYKYKEEDINLLLKRIGKASSNIEREELSLLKNNQKCFQMNVPNDIFNLNPKEYSIEEKENNLYKSIDRFLIPLVDIDNTTRISLYDPLSSNYVNIGNEAFTELKNEKELNKRLNYSTENNLSRLISNNNKMDIEKESKQNSIKNKSIIQIPGKSIFDLFG